MKASCEKLPVLHKDRNSIQEGESGTNDARSLFAGWDYQVEYEVLARGEGS